MNELPPILDPLGQLAAHLTKLSHQLRHLLGGGAVLAGADHAASSVAVCGRLKVAASILSAEEASSLSRLGHALAGLMNGLGPHTDSVPAHLLEPLQSLADYLGRIFTRSDAGEPLPVLAADPGWGDILTQFFHAGSILQPLDRIEAEMQAWSRTYGELETSVSQDDALRRRWALIRAFGDSIFGCDEAADGGDDPAARAIRRLEGLRLLLLLESPFRRAQLRERLRGWGCLVESVSTPRSLLARVADPVAPEVLLCDNLEPSLHFAAVRAALPQGSDRGGPVLVLVASAGGSAASLQERARQVGAQGTWAEPFRPADLALILDRNG